MLFTELWPGRFVSLQWSVGLLAVSAFGCASSSSKPPEDPSASDTLELAEEKETSAEPETPPEDVVPQAARPFTGYRAGDGLALTDEELITYLASADGICIGESHGEALSHYAELRLITGLLARRPMRGFELGIGMEMFRTEAQSALNRFSAGETSAGELAEQAKFSEEWGVPLQFYQSQLNEAREGRAGLVALGVPKALTRKVSEAGLSGLKPEERRRVPELDRSLSDHRALFDALMKGHPGPTMNLEHYYEAQLIWDEQMAETGAAWLRQRSPGRKLLILAGKAHCHRSGIPARFARRSGALMVSVLPVSGGKPAKVTEKPEGADEHLARGYDFQMVFD